MAFVFVNQKYCKRISIVSGYVEDFSVNRGEDVIAYLQPTEEHKKGILLIYNLKGEIVDSLVCNLQFQDTIYKNKIYEKGYGFSNKCIYNTSKLKSGIYFFGNVVPFLVKDTSIIKAKTVVFPFANMMASNNDGGKSFDKFNSSNLECAEFLSSNRRVNLYRFLVEKPFLNWIDSIANKDYNFISDLDLENYKSIKNSDILIMHGNFSFISYNQRNTLEKFQNRNGSSLIISSDFMKNKFNIIHESRKFQFKAYGDTTYKIENRLGLWNNFEPSNHNTNLIGCSSEISYTSNNLKSSYGGYKIIDFSHPIFKGIHSNVIKVNTKNSNSIAVEHINFEQYPIPDNSNLNFYKNQILAFDYSIYYNKQTITSISFFQRKENSGKIIFIGTDNWLSFESVTDGNIKLITKNAIDFLKN
jgi:hypothetical protein